MGRMEAVRVDDAGRWTQYGGFSVFLVRWQRNNGTSCFADTSMTTAPSPALPAYRSLPTTAPMLLPTNTLLLLLTVM